ncbi:General transcription factor IIH subunit 4 [Aphanomyces cochlioides]|nr:General transcription factor IIH subunit 4 [Aphanomyces cochlioides]
MNAFEYLGALPGTSLDRLYQDPWACQAVFQSMNPLSQQIVMRLLFTTTHVSKDALMHWIQDSAQSKMTAAIEKLCHLRVLRPVQGTNKFGLNPAFQEKLKTALSSLGGSPWEAGRKNLPPEKPIAAVDLEQYARKRWDAVLHFMVGSTAVPAPPKEVIGILEHTRLMKPSETDARALHITDTGYEFMLKDIHAQTWIFVLNYIKDIDRKGILSADEMLQFFFQMSYCRMNEYYAVADLTRHQQQLLGDLVQLGLLYRKDSKATRFYTTSLAVNLIFGGMAGQTRTNISMVQSLEAVHQQASSQVVPRPIASTSSASHLLIVVETNFKVYAYTESTLHIAMLSVFVDIVARLPNLAVGYLTRESIRSALIHGISAEQIYDFLMQHAHPKMLANSPVIPENIADQLYLWQRERNRIKFDAGELLDGFVTTEDFDSVVKYAQDLHVLMWHDAVHLKLVVTKAGGDAVRQFMQNH